MGNDGNWFDAYHEVLAIVVNMACYHYERNAEMFDRECMKLEEHLRNGGREDNALVLAAKREYWEQL